MSSNISAQVEHEDSPTHVLPGLLSSLATTVAFALTAFVAYGAARQWKFSFYKILIQQNVSNALFLQIYGVFFFFGVACDFAIFVNFATVFGYALQYAKFVTLIQKVLLSLNRCFAVSFPVFYSNQDSKFALPTGIIAWLIPFIPVFTFALHKKCQYKYIAHGWYIAAVDTPKETCGASLHYFIWDAQLAVFVIAGLVDVVTLMMLIRYHRATQNSSSSDQHAKVEISMGLQTVAGGVILAGETMVYWHMGRVQQITDPSKMLTAWQTYFLAPFAMILVPFLDSLIVMIINSTIRQWAFSKQRLCCWTARRNGIVHMEPMELEAIENQQ